MKEGGWTYQNLGGANSNFEILNWAFHNVFWSWVTSGGSNPARLGELRSPGRVGRQPPPPFSYKKAEGGCSKDPSAPWLCISAVLGEKNCFREENPSRGASVTLPRCFRKQIREGFRPFFIIHHPFFVLQRVSFRIRDFQFISCFFKLSSLFSISFLQFLTCFNHLFKSFSHLINDKMNFNRSFVL